MTGSETTDGSTEPVRVEEGELLSEQQLSETLQLSEKLQTPDPLLACLRVVARHHQLPCNPEVAVAGLPLHHGHLSPQLFGRAAAKSGIDAKVVERAELVDINSIALPAVLLLEDNQACVLLSIDTVTHQCVVQFSLDRTPETSDVHTLQNRYTGFVILCKPAPDLQLAQPEKHWFWSALAQSWRIYRDVILASFLINLFAIFSPLFTMNVYDRVVPNNAIETLWVLVIGISIVFTFELLVKTLRVYFLEIAGKKADVLMSSAIFEHVLGIRMENQPKSVGGFISQLREFESIRQFVTSTTVVALIDLPFVLFFVLIVFFIGGWLVLVPLVIAPLMVAYGMMIQPALRKAVESGYGLTNQKHALLNEAVSQREAIKSLVAEGYWQRLWENVVGELAVSGQKGRLLTMGVNHVSMFLQQFATVVTVTAGVYLIGAGNLTMGALIASVMLISRALAPMGQVVNLQANYFQTRTAIDGINQTMSLPLDRPTGRTFLQKTAIHGEIEFRNVSFAFNKESLPVLQNVSFRIKPGEKVAVIGRIGSGKSTLQKLVMGLYQPTGGMVLIDGVDLRQLDPAFVRMCMSHMSQEFLLFDDSVRNNITRGELFPDDARLAKVVVATGVAEFVRENPLGLDMPVGERGGYLSGGQRQSVMMARTLFREASVYLLDEPTSQMDSSSEELVRRELPHWTAGATVLLTTHKASMMDLVDRIIVLDRGRVVADGPRQQVLEALQRGEVKVNAPPR